jgi:hypothetical protein
LRLRPPVTFRDHQERRRQWVRECSLIAGSYRISEQIRMIMSTR